MAPSRGVPNADFLYCWVLFWVLAGIHCTLFFYTVAYGGYICRIECGPEPMGLDDWILDVCWLECDRSSGNGLCSVAAVTAHNAVHIIRSSEGELSRHARVVANYYCEVNCILYPSCSRYVGVGCIA